MTFAETAAYQPGFWASVWKLLRLRWMITLNGFRRANTRRKVGWIILGLFILAGVGFVLYLSMELLSFLRTPEMAQLMVQVAGFLENIPAMILGLAFFGVFITSFGVLLQALYLSRDMDFLLTAPIPIRAVFMTKLLQAILPNFLLISLFALPVLVGLGLMLDYSFIYYPLVVLLLAALALAAAGLASLLVMLIVRVFPARRVAELLGFIGAILSILCSQSGQLARYENFPPDQAMQVFTNFSRVNVSWSPIGWAGAGLIGVGRSAWWPGLAYLLLTLGLCVGIFFGALVVSERWYYTGWAAMQNKRRKRKTSSPARAASLPAGARWYQRVLSPAVSAIVIKDFQVLRRDLRNMSQLVTPLVIGIVYAVMILRRGTSQPSSISEFGSPIASQLMDNLSVYANVGLALFVGWMLLGRLGGRGFSQEGKCYWLLKAAPLSVGQLLSSKFLVAFLPSLLLGWGFLIVISLLHHPSRSVLWFSLPLVALSISANAAINLAFGVVGARFDWEDPRQMVRGTTGCFAALATLICVPLSLLLFFGPVLLAALLRMPVVMGQVFGLLLGGGFCLALTFIPLWLVRDRVPVLGEG